MTTSYTIKNNFVKINLQLATPILSFITSKQKSRQPIYELLHSGNTLTITFSQTSEGNKLFIAVVTFLISNPDMKPITNDLANTDVNRNGGTKKQHSSNPKNKTNTVNKSHEHEREREHEHKREREHESERTHAESFPSKQSVRKNYNSNVNTNANSTASDVSVQSDDKPQSKHTRSICKFGYACKGYNNKNDNLSDCKFIHRCIYKKKCKINDCKLDHYCKFKECNKGEACKYKHKYKNSSSVSSTKKSQSQTMLSSE
jgi:hypothetical protein